MKLRRLTGRRLPCLRKDSTPQWSVLRCEISTRLMTAVGQNRHCGDFRCITALAPKAEVHPRSCYVAFVPQPDSCTAAGRDAGSTSSLIWQAFLSFTRTVFVSVGSQLGKFQAFRCSFVPAS